MNTTPKHTPPTPKYIPTNQLAATFGVQPDTIRRNLCTRGHYLGMKPIKLPNGRLLWPMTSPEKISEGA